MSYIDRTRRYLQTKKGVVIEPEVGSWQVEIYTPIGWRHVGLSLLPLKWRADSLALDSALMLLRYYKNRRYPGEFRAYNRATQDILMGVIL